MDEELERERLRRAIRNSRALSRVGQIAAALGWLWLGALAIFPPAVHAGGDGAALAVGVGGLVLAGSSQTTTQELETSLAALEAPTPGVADVDGNVISLFGPAARGRRPRPRL